MVWAEAMDGGNPKEKVPHRDRIMSLAAPFRGVPTQLLETQERFERLEPITGGDLALVTDYERNKKWVRTFEVDLSKTGDAGKLIFARDAQDRYKDEGTPVTKMTAEGPVIVRSGDNILLDGLGASPTGDHPFLDRYNLATEKPDRLFQSKPGSYEAVAAVLDSKGERVITRRESPSIPPTITCAKAGRRRL